MLHIGDYIRLV